MKNVNKFYEIGTDRINITPPLTIPYLGFTPRHSYFTGVHDNLYASAAVISDGNKEIALVSIDSIGIYNGILGNGRDFTEEVKKSIEKETNIKNQAIMLMSAHIHSTPDTLGFRSLIDEPGGLGWLEGLMDKLCKVVKSAQQKKSKAQLKIGKGRVDGVSYNRRGESCLDNEVIVLLFDLVEKNKNILFVNFACHPVIVQVQELVSADYIGSMREIVMNGLKHTQECLFIQGACGDINPIKDDTRDFKDVYLKGALLAGEIIKILGMLGDAPYPDKGSEIKYASSKISLAPGILPSNDECKKILETYKELENQVNRNRCDHLQSADLERKITIMGDIRNRIQEGLEPYIGEVQAIRIGNAVIVGIPGEPFCKMGIEVKEMFNPLTAIPAGYTNGYLGYIAPRESWERGGYEVSLGPWNKLNKDAYYEILEEIEKISSAII